MEHSSKSFGILHFTPDSASVISRLWRAIGDSRTFKIFIIYSSISCLNAYINFFVWTLHGLIDHFISILWPWAIKCQLFVEDFLCDYMHLKCYIEVNPNVVNFIFICFLWWKWHNGKILDMTNVCLFSPFFIILPTDVAWYNIFSFVHVG